MGVLGEGCLKAYSANGLGARLSAEVLYKLFAHVRWLGPKSVNSPPMSSRA